MSAAQETRTISSAGHTALVRIDLEAGSQRKPSAHIDMHALP